MSSEQSEGAAAADGKSAAWSPVVIDLGKQSRKRVKALRKGKPGKLLDEVGSAVEALRAQGTLSPTAQPVIVIVRERRKKPLWLGG